MFQCLLNMSDTTAQILAAPEIKTKAKDMLCTSHVQQIYHCFWCKKTTCRDALCLFWCFIPDTRDCGITDSITVAVCDPNQYQIIVPDAV